MIALLRGRVASRGADHIVLDVQGVGYLVYTPTPLITSLPDDREITLHIATIVREDDFLLFGFEHTEERDAFNMLRQVNGVGPRIALAALSGLTIDTIHGALSQSNAAVLTQVSGIGKRLAERMCLELQTKIPAAIVPLRVARRAEPDPLTLALARLDYKKSEIDIAMSSPDVPGLKDATVDLRLSAALRVLSRPL